MTTFENRCAILSDFFYKYPNDTRFTDFFAKNNLGLPLAFLVDEDIVSRTDVISEYIDSTFDSLLELLGIGSDTGFDKLDEIIGE
jgi:hypothetical protein